MKVSLKTGGSLIVLAGLASAAMATPAKAQDAAQIKAIQSQIQLLQKQLQSLQVESARRDAELKRAQDEAAAARAAAAQAQVTTPAASLSVPSTVPAGSAIVTIPPNDKDAAGKPFFNANKPNGKFNLGGVTVTLGGFIDLTGLYRSRNENDGVATSFASGIPYPNSPNYRTGEIRATAQQSRISGLLQGSPYDGAVVSGYAEADFQSAGSSSNSQQTNSYTLRIRQAYAQFDDSNDNLHVLGGQAWSFLTPFKSGLTPRSENVPPVLENSIVQGFAYARQPQVRISTDYEKVAFFGLSVEAPQSTFSGTKPGITGALLDATSVGYPGTTATSNTGGTTGTYNNAGTIAGGGLNPVTTYSYNTLPDFIAKTAIEPGFGHYELYGILRFFKDEKITVGDSGDLTSTGGGLGASAFVSVVPGLIDVSGNILAGYGIGRYGSAGLPDATYKANGSPQPLPEVEAMLGVVGHVTPKLDLYTYGGIEEEERKYGTVGGAAYGYGNPAFSNAGCSVISSSATAQTTCTANTRSSTGVQIGGWYKLFQSGIGTLQTGASYEWNQRAIFNGVGGAPSVNENVFLLTLRYLPFQ
jgi:hypothetical protein